MALFGGSESVSEQSTTNVIDTKNTGLSDTQGYALADIGGPVNITSTDQKAVEAGAFLGAQSLDFAQDSLNSILELAGGVTEGQNSQIQNTLSAVTDSQKRVAASQQTSSNNIVQAIGDNIAILAAVAGIAIVMLKK